MERVELAIYSLGCQKNLVHYDLLIIVISRTFTDFAFIQSLQKLCHVDMRCSSFTTINAGFIINHFFYRDTKKYIASPSIGRNGSYTVKRDKCLLSMII